MSQPLVVSIPHQLGRAEAARRLKSGIDWAREKYGSIISIQQELWTDDDLAFRVGALGQSADGSVHVSDTDVTLSVRLPWLLARFADKAQSLLQQKGHLMLEKK